MLDVVGKELKSDDIRRLQHTLLGWMNFLHVTLKIARKPWESGLAILHFQGLLDIFKCLG